MAANSDGYKELSTILTCEGDLSDPRFPTQLNCLVNSLNTILGELVKVHKLEPWNSVRVTLSIPREAALRLRQLANEGSQQLRALGILSVQVDGDQVISLRIATGSEPQEIILRTSQDGGNSNNNASQSDLGTFLQTNATSVSASNNMQVQFKSPNVVCPPDTVVPKVGANTVPPNNVASTNKPFAGPFPFTSMNQAIHSNRDTPFNSLPPPYPSKHPPVTISSPLLVNLLQNDGGKESGSGVVKTMAPARTATSTSSEVSTTAAPEAARSIPSTQANSSSISPSALATNTSIRQNSTVMTSTTGVVNKTPAPPPQYHRTLSNPGKVKQASSVPGLQNVNNTISSSLPNSSFTQMPRTTQSTAVPIQHNNMYQHQLGTAALLKNSVGQPNVAAKHLLSQKPITSPNAFAKGPVSVPVAKAIPNVLNNTHQKLVGAQPNVSLPKTSTVYLPQQVKSNFLHASASVVSQNLNAPVSNPNFNNVALRGMPSPPPYSVAVSSRQWDSLVNSNNSLMDLTPTLTDLKPDDLDALLPSLEGELTQSPLPDLPEDFLADHATMISDELPAAGDNRKFLINPLTGELEPQSSGESDTEELKDVFTGLPSPTNLSDEDTCSTTRPDTTTDQSDSETRSSDTAAAAQGGKPQRVKNSKARERGRDSPALKPEKIKLRLKLEKSEPINPAYKVDVSFVNQQPKKGTASLMTPGEELRVPPLHISLRGRNSAVIKNKNKLNPDGSPVKLKVRKNQDYQKMKKNEVGSIVGATEESENVNSLMMDVSNSSMLAARLATIEQKKNKKLKAIHEHKDVFASLTQESDLKSKFVIHNHYKDKQKERRGSDSELVKTKKFLDGSGAPDDKKRRLSQSEQIDDDQPVLGSTNVGTIAGLPQKNRKDKVKIKEVFKKDANKNNKIFSKNFAEKLQAKTVTLPTAGEMNMEAKFKQGLLEGTGEKGISRPPHRTEIVNHLSTEPLPTIETSEIAKESAPVKEKSPEPDKCNTPNNRKSIDGAEKPSVVSVGNGNGNRSPNSGGNQGEDSGIESMDALSEKSPNQASQSPHADILPPKTQVPNMLDIEAQLAKMEGLNGDSDRLDGIGNLGENKREQDGAAKDSVKQDVDASTLTNNKQSVETNHTVQKAKKEDDDLEPLPVRVTPALYTYSNPDKSRAVSPALSDDDVVNNTLLGNKQNKSLLEQLLIEIPTEQTLPSSPSPATRSSMRTRALSKLNSPELNSPVAKAQPKAATAAKRKRNESDSSNQSLDETKKKSRRVAAGGDANQNADAVVKKQNDSTAKSNNLKKHLKAQAEGSSDSDEPISEKVRKTALNAQVKSKSGKTGGPGNVANNNAASTTMGGTASSKGNAVVSTRRSVRSNMPAQNTRSKGENNKVSDKSESEALRRKTRSTVSDVENKRKKEVK